jgi:hypothetical protein
VKLCLHGNSLRFRLNRSDVEQFRQYQQPSKRNVNSRKAGSIKIAAALSLKPSSRNVNEDLKFPREPIIPRQARSRATPAPPPLAIAYRRLLCETNSFEQLLETRVFMKIVETAVDPQK